MLVDLDRWLVRIYNDAGEWLDRSSSWVILLGAITIPYVIQQIITTCGWWHDRFHCGINRAMKCGHCERRWLSAR